MRWLLLPFLLVGSSGLAASAPAELLATFADHAQGTDIGHAFFDFCDVDLVLGDSEARLFDAAALGPTQQPVLFEATAANDPAAFAAVATLFTNGLPDEFEIELTGASGGGIGLGTNDCGLFFADYDCNLGVDMKGGTIDRITLEIREPSLEPYEDGTAIFVDVALQVFGTPEPGAALLGLVAIAALAARGMTARCQSALGRAR
jgi:hypothetical protein